MAGLKCLSAGPGGWFVFALPECVRATVGTTGPSRHSSPVDSVSSVRPLCAALRALQLLSAKGPLSSGAGLVHAFTKKFVHVFSFIKTILRELFS